MSSLPPFSVVSSRAQRWGQWRLFWVVMRRAARELAAHDPLRLGAATAFFTTFALPPIILILVQLLRSLYPASLVRAMLLTKLGDLLGPSAAGLMGQILYNVNAMRRSQLVTVLGFVFLLFIATTLFGVIQSSLNELWQLRPARSYRHRQWRQAGTQRLRSLGELLATGVLSAVAFGVDALLALVRNYIRDFGPTLGYYLLQGVNFVISWLILAVWCAVTFRTLPSARVPFPAVWRGALLTATFIELGEQVLGFLLVPRNLGPIYGPASGVVLVLLFVFYSAMIFYFGACVTKVYAHYAGHDIQPGPGAVRYRVVER